MPRLAVIVGTALLAVLPQIAQARPQPTPRLTILAAASLTEVFPRIDRRPAYSFGGSNQLALQIRQGAPADVFASAAPNFTQDLFKEGRVEKPRTFASNKLVLAVPRSNPAGLSSVFDLRRRSVKLVVGTARVPIGAYTRQVLRNLGMTQRALEGRERGAGRQEHRGQGRAGRGRRRLRLPHRRPARPRPSACDRDPGVGAAEGALRDRRGAVEQQQGGGARLGAEDPHDARARRLLTQAGFGLE